MDRVKTIEQALDIAGYGHYNMKLFMYFSCIVISLTLEYFSTFYLLLPSAYELNTTSSQQNLIAQFPMIGLMAFGMKWGYMADSIGRKKILQIALVMTAIFGTSSAFSPHWIVLLILKLLSALSVGGALTSSLALLTESTPLKRRSALVILTMSTVVVALGTMTGLSASVLTLNFSLYFLGIYFNSWRLLCLLFALPSIICAFGVRYVFESPMYLLVKERDYQALEVLKGIYTMNNRVSVDTYKVLALILNEDNVDTKHMNGFKAYITVMMSVIKNRSMYFGLLTMMLLTGYLCTYMYIGVLPVVASAFWTSDVNGTSLTVCEMVRRHQNTTTVEEGKDYLVNKFGEIMTFAVGISLAGLNVLFYIVFKFIGRKKLIFGIQVLVAVASLCINFCPIGALNAILFLFILFGVFNVGLLCTYAIDIFPSYGKATAIGLTVAGSLGSLSFASSYIKKFLSSNCEVSFYILMAIACVGALLTLFLPSEKTVSGMKKIIEESHNLDSDNTVDTDADGETTWIPPKNRPGHESP